MLSKALIFVFATFGIFAVLIGTMTNELITQTFSPKYVDPQVQEYFEAADVLMYQNVASDNMTYPYSSLEDGPAPPDWEFGLPAGQYLEVWWSSVWDVEIIQLRHATSQWWGWAWAGLQFKFLNGTWVGDQAAQSEVLTRDILIQAWNGQINSSGFYAYGPLTTSILFCPTDSTNTIGEAWDEGEISYAVSYEINWNQTGINAWSIVGQLLTFQTPDLGIGGVGGTILTMLIAFPFWSLIAYIVYKIVAGLIPFMSGGSGD